MWLFDWLMSSAEKSVANSFEYDFDNWEIDSHYVRHKPSGLVLWINRGWKFLDVPEGSGKYPQFTNIFTRFILWQHFKRMRNMKIKKDLYKETVWERQTSDNKKEHSRWDPLSY